MRENTYIGLHHMQRILERNLHKQIEKIGQLSVALERIYKAGGFAYFVGGTSRDLIYHAHRHRYEIVIPYDIDIEVFGLTEQQLTDILGVDMTGKDFPVYNANYTVQHYDPLTKKTGFEIYDVQYALPRRERKTGVGYKGFESDVDPNMPIEEAAFRRDLTINAVYIELSSYIIIDCFNGLGDLLEDFKADVIDISTFSQDPLRVLRAARMLDKYNLEPTQALKTASVALLAEYQYLTPELREKELMKLLGLPYVGPGIKFLEDVGWWQKVCPRYDDLHRHYVKRLAEYGDYEMPSKQRAALFFAVICEAMNDQQIDGFFESINPNWNGDTRTTVKQLVQAFAKFSTLQTTDRFLSIARWIRYQVPAIAELFGIYLGTMTSYDAKWDFEDAWTDIHGEFFPLIKGDDVLACKIEQGPLVGEILNFFKNNHIEGNITDKDIAKNMLRHIVDLIQ